MKPYTYKLIIILIILGIPNYLFSQGKNTPLMPEKIFYKNQVGLFIGLGSNWQSGSYYVDCIDCEFEGGSGFGFTVGGLYEINTMGDFRFGLMASYDIMSTETSFIEIEPFQFYSEAYKQNIEIPIQFRHLSDLDLSYFNISPYAKLEMFDFMFIRLAFTAGFPISSNIKHTKALIDDFAQLQTGEYVEIILENGEKEAVVQDSDYEPLTSPIFTIDPAIGINIEISERTYFSPGFMYRVPMTVTSENGENFMLNSWRIFFELRFTL